MRGLARALLGLIFMAGAAAAQSASGARVAVTFDGVRSDTGQVMAVLCGDPPKFMVGCNTYTARVPAKAGATEVVFEGVKPGAYALQAFHDENGDGRAQIPPEGYAFGNDVSFPPTFQGASITIAGDTRVRARMTYLIGAGSQVIQGSGVAAPPGVTKTDVREQGLYAELYVPARKGRLPAVVMIGGSDGGLDAISRMAVSFTEHGYAVLALAYWGVPGLPQTLENVPLEYFHTALGWLKARPEVDPARIGLIGWSRGAEAALLIGGRERDVRAVVAVAPSSLVWQGLNMQGSSAPQPAWTVGGVALPYAVPRPPPGYRPDQPLKAMFDMVLAQAAPETAIPAERIHGPILLLSGEDDRLWPSKEMGDRLAARLKAKGFAYEYRHLAYPGAGHVVFVGDPKGPGGAYGSSQSGSAFLGGSPAANAAAWADNWPKTLDFFDRALKR
jgi:dienelactone hydrolase/uncharacterized protein (DUF2141 family)